MPEHDFKLIRRCNLDHGWYLLKRAKAGYLSGINIQSVIVNTLIYIDIPMSFIIIQKVYYVTIPYIVIYIIILSSVKCNFITIYLNGVIHFNINLYIRNIINLG